MYVVRRSGFEGWQCNYNKILESHKNFECYVPTKIQETNIVNSNLSISSVLIIFNLHFGLLSEQQNGRGGHISLRL